jgi:hypothetical protein
VGEPFDPNDYRKRVLAAVERRGGPETSDSFELYDLPVSDDLDDAFVAARVAEVWGAWQRQRDHPKYRVLVAMLVEGHAVRSAELLDAGRRRAAVAYVRAQREQRDSARFALLDAAASRLVARYRGLPRDKIEGLHEVGALAGLTRDEVTARLRRHRLVDAAAAEPDPGIGVERRRQVRVLLDELGRLTDTPAPPTLLALLELGPAASEEQIRARAAAWRSRARELPPARLRSVLDELLVHVAELLEPGRAAVEAYLDAVTADVTDHLRPRVRAAVLVEDRLVTEDHAHLLDEAVSLGLDDARARAVLAAIAAELGAPVDAGGPAAPPHPIPDRPIPDRPTPDRPAARPAAPPPDRAWEAPLKAARAALRAARPVEAQRLAREAQRLVGEAGPAGSAGATPVRAVADEIEAVLADAALRWKAANAALAGRRYTEARDQLDHLHRTAADVPDPQGGDLDGYRARAAGEVRRADDATAAALAGPDADRAAALAAVLDACPGHPGAAAALAAIPVEPPAWVRAARDGRGDVLVVWDPSPTAGVGYKVSRLRPDGAWHVVGRVSDTTVVDGGAPAAVEAPVYAVTAVAGGRASTATRSDEESPPVVPSAPPAPTAVRAERHPDGAVTVCWDGGPDGAEFRVRCRMPDGRWRVVGRTRDRAIEDGGAPAGPLPGYAVSAAVGGERSAETASAP